MPARGDRPYRYIPSPVPTDISLHILEFLREEFVKVYEGQRSIYQLPIITVEPNKPREGLLVYADGTEWNPGSGKGVYVHNGTTWVKL